ncbi:unnamed protein product, partial [Discosporangium mesarthrocarpum]
MREAGEGCFPAGLGNKVKEEIKGKFVVQVENAKDIAKSFEQREGSSSHHTLKLAVGDGKQTVVALEYRRIQGMSSNPSPGLKLFISCPWVRRGVLLLSEENTVVLGGEVPSLVEARAIARGERGKEKGKGKEKEEQKEREGDGGHGTRGGPDGQPQQGSNQTMLRQEGTRVGGPAHAVEGPSDGKAESTGWRPGQEVGLRSGRSGGDGGGRVTGTGQVGGCPEHSLMPGNAHGSGSNVSRALGQGDSPDALAAEDLMVGGSSGSLMAGQGSPGSDFLDGSTRANGEGNMGSKDG